MSEKKSAAQRLGLVLEKVTSQSSRLLSTPRVRVVDPRPGLGEPTASPRPHPVHPDDLRPRREPDRRERRGPRRHRRLPGAQRLRLAALWITFAVAPAYVALAFIVGVIWATNRVINNVRWAIEEREPSPQGSAQYLLRPVEADARYARPLGRRNRRAHRPIRPAGHRLHTQSPSRHQLRGASSCRPAAICSPSSHCVRSPRRHSKVGPSAAPLRTGHHGPNLTVWALGSGVPVLGILLAAIITLSLHNVSPTQFAVAVMTSRSSPWCSASS